MSDVTYPITLMERDDSDHRVELVYHGPAAKQKVTVHVHWYSGEFPDFAFGVQDERALDAFHHPHYYETLAA